jgi:hypothetical protein
LDIAIFTFDLVKGANRSSSSYGRSECIIFFVIIMNGCITDMTVKTQLDSTHIYIFKIKFKNTHKTKSKINFQIATCFIYIKIRAWPTFQYFMKEHLIRQTKRSLK